LLGLRRTLLLLGLLRPLLLGLLRALRLLWGLLGVLLLRGRPTLLPVGLALLVSFAVVLCVNNGHHHSKE
jgi:hypothetical protein